MAAGCRVQGQRQSSLPLACLPCTGEATWGMAAGCRVQGQRQSSLPLACLPCTGEAMRCDARQRARAGELHNNARMTWGKAFIGWASPAEALAALIRCNHRFALDGCGPCSYGGILWCGWRMACLPWLCVVCCSDASHGIL